MTAPVPYRCPDHGAFVARVRSGHGAPPAPESWLCPRCQAPAVRLVDPVAAGRRATDGRRSIVLDAAIADRLDAYCEAQGVTVDAVLAALVPDAGAKP